MTLCPKCGAMLFLTTAGEICQNCGWNSLHRVTTVSNGTVLPTESREVKMMRTDINDLTIRVSALEADLKRLKEIIKEKDEQSESQEKSTKDNSTLKSCPFCECSQIMTWHIGHYDKPWIAECVKCLAQGPHADTEEEAIEEWNRRVGE